MYLFVSASLQLLGCLFWFPSEWEDPSSLLCGCSPGRPPVTGHLDELQGQDHVTKQHAKKSTSCVSVSLRGAMHCKGEGRNKTSENLAPSMKVIWIDVNISRATRFTRQVSFLAFWEASQQGREMDHSLQSAGPLLPTQSSCLSHWVTPPCFLELEWLSFPSLRSCCSDKPNLWHCLNSRTFFSSWLGLALRCVSSVPASNRSLPPYPSLKPSGLVTRNQRPASAKEDLKGQLIQPPTRDMPSRTNHPRCWLIIFCVVTQYSCVISGERAHPQETHGSELGSAYQPELLVAWYP